MQKDILAKIKQDYTDMCKIISSDFLIDNYYRQADIFCEIINKYSNGLIKQTNNIWFWFFNMKVREYEEMFSTSLDKADKDSTIAVYFDLENSTKVITIPIDEQIDFESNNNVIRGKRTIDDPVDRYYNARYEFFNLCVNKEQDLAVKVMLQIERSRAKDIEAAKELELTQLSNLLNLGVISKEKYNKKKQLILSKR